MSDPVDQLENRMSWPSTPTPKRPRRQRRPKPPPLTLRHQQRRVRRRVGARIIGVTLVAIILPVVLAVTVVVLVGRVDKPATVPPDWAPPTELPRAADGLALGDLVLASDRAGAFGIFAMRPDGQNIRPLVEDPRWDSWGPRLAPDRRTVLFYRTPAGEKNRDPGRASLWAARTDRTGAPVLLRPAGLDGWVVQSHAEWTLYGDGLIMSGGGRANPQIWLTDALGQRPRQLTDRPGANTDPSLTPDGREIFFVGCPRDDCEPQERELYRMPAGGPPPGGQPERLTNDRSRDREPYVSVGGDRLAWLSFAGVAEGDGWQVRMANRRGPVVENPRSLLPRGGEDVVGRPQFSSDGSRIYVHMKPAGRATSGVFAISINTPAAPVELTLGQLGNYEDPSL